MSFPVMQTNRLLLRQFTEADLADVFNGLSHPDVIRYYGVSYNTIEDTRKQMQFFADLEKNGTGTWWAICSRDNSVFFGAVGINSVSAAHKKGEIGFWLLPGCWGKGIVQEAMTCVCDHGFGVLGLHRLEAFVESENTSCKRVMDKIGFVYEGCMKDCEYKNGRFISLWIYARLHDQSG